MFDDEENEKETERERETEKDGVNRGGGKEADE